MRELKSLPNVPSFCLMSPISQISAWCPKCLQYLPNVSNFCPMLCAVKSRISSNMFLYNIVFCPCLGLLTLPTDSAPKSKRKRCRIWNFCFLIGHPHHPHHPQAPHITLPDADTDPRYVFTSVSCSKWMCTQDFENIIEKTCETRMRRRMCTFTK